MGHAEGLNEWWDMEWFQKKKKLEGGLEKKKKKVRKSGCLEGKKKTKKIIKYKKKKAGKCSIWKVYYSQCIRITAKTMQQP